MDYLVNVVQRDRTSVMRDWDDDKRTGSVVHNERARCPHNVRRKEGGRRREEEGGKWRMESGERKRKKEDEGVGGRK